MTVRRQAMAIVLAVCVSVMAAHTSPATAATLAPPDASAPTHGALYYDGPTDRWLLGGSWLYRADPTNVGVTDDFEAATSSTAGWTPVTVPNSFNAGDFSTASWNGSIGWYRRDFTLPAGAFASYVPKQFQSWVVRFESVNYQATVWLNGKQIGSHAGAYLPWELKLTGLHSGVNELVIRVSSIRDGGDLPPGPGGSWWNFGGIQREVYLRAIQEVDMTPVVVRPILPCPTCAATIQESVTVNNPTDAAQTVSLTGTYGIHQLNFGGHTIPAHGTWVAHAQTVVQTPNLWAPGSPYLYNATITAHDALGRTLEVYRTQSGIRSIQVNAAGQLLLNGRVLDLRGFSMHELNITTGAALTTQQLEDLITWDRDLGGDIIRAHYPLGPLVEQMADRDGILLWSEIPVYQTKSEYLNRPAWLSSAHDMLRQNILDNENHPSILLWSIGNELAQPSSDSEARYIQSSAQIAHQLDPTRPVGMATLWWPGLPCQAAHAPLDVIGVNDYVGWFDSGNGSGDALSNQGPALDATHACYPTKAMMVTEIGYDGSQNGPAEVKGTYQYAAAAASYSYGVFASKPYLSGVIWFALQDFPAFPGWTGGDPFGTAPFVQKGPINLYGQPVQPIYDTLSAIYHSTVQVGPAPATAPARRASIHRGGRSRRP